MSRRYDVEAAGGVVLRSARDGDAAAVLVVHRPHHADWSLPKGKLDPGEDHAAAAVREVLEETGVHARIDGELPATEYRVRAGHKRVRWYVMRPRKRSRDATLGADDTGTFRADHAGEVDEVRWVPVDEADVLLTHDLDRATLEAALGADT